MNRKLICPTNVQHRILNEKTNILIAMLFFISVPASWISLSTFGPLTLKPYHITTLCLIPFAFPGTLLFFQKSATRILPLTFFFSFIAYIFLFIIMGALLSNPLTGYTIPFFAKQLIYVGMLLIIMEYFRKNYTILSSRTFARLFTIFTFVFFVTVIFYLVTADSGFKVSSLFDFGLGTRIRVSNILFAQLSISPEIFNKRIFHSISSGLFVLMVLSALLLTQMQSGRDRLLIYLCMYIYIYLIALLFQRSVVLAAICFFILIYISGDRRRAIFSVFAIPALSIFLILLIDTPQGGSLMYRLKQITFSIGALDKHIFTGWGGYVTVYDSGIHNVLLRSWLECGVFCFLLSLIYMFSLVYIIFAGVFMGHIYNRQTRYALFGLSLPLIRENVSAGGMDFAEWLTVGLAFAFFSIRSRPNEP